MAGKTEEGAIERPSPAEVNAAGNKSRLNRMEEISRVADGKRAQEMVDVDGDRATGRFAGGEFDDSPEAREAQALREQDEAEQALREQADRAQLEEEEDQREAKRLQEEGSPGDEGGARAADEDDAHAGDEKVVDGVRYYLTIVNGQEKWLTLKELRSHAAASAQAEETLQRAQDALQRATQAEFTPEGAPAEELDDKVLENIVLSAGMGDEEAVRKLVSVIKGKPAGASPAQVARLVSQQIATQREVDKAETAQADLLGNKSLAPLFRMRLSEYGSKNPKARIVDAYQAVGDSMRKDFAPMLQQSNVKPNLSKDQRKRGIVNPPRSAGRQPPREDDDREVPVSDQIDAIAKARGQDRAHRIRRS